MNPKSFLYILAPGLGRIVPPGCSPTVMSASVQVQSPTVLRYLRQERHKGRHKKMKREQTCPRFTFFNQLRRLIQPLQIIFGLFLRVGVFRFFDGGLQGFAAEFYILLALRVGNFHDGHAGFLGHDGVFGEGD
jgi:hypothetical protein